MCGVAKSFAKHWSLLRKALHCLIRRKCMGKRIGIDLGTTNSVMSCADGQRPAVLQTRENGYMMRSVVSYRKRRGRGDGAGEMLVGDSAIDNMPTAVEDTIMSIKRLMGRRFDDKEVQEVRHRVQYRI